MGRPGQAGQAGRLFCPRADVTSSSRPSVLRLLQPEAPDASAVAAEPSPSPNTAHGLQARPAPCPEGSSQKVSFKIRITPGSPSS